MANDQANIKSRSNDIEPALCDAEGAAAMLGISVSMFHRLKSGGRIGPRKISFGAKCSRYSVAELREWARAGAPARSQWLQTGGCAQ